MTAPSYASEPQIQYLHQVLDQIAKGELQVPDFQRESRWTDDQRRKLLESVSHGYPIGALMVWRTTKELDCIHDLGDRRLPPAVQGSARQYVLDGTQRLSTLFAALWAPVRGQADLPSVASEARRQVPESRWRLGYHLEKEEWVFMNDVDDSEVHIVVPGRILLSSVELLRFQRKIKHSFADEFVERADAISSAIRGYKVAILPLVSESVEEASKTFGLVNSQGTPMSALDLIHALTWSEEFNLRKTLRRATEQLHSIGWSNFDEKYYLAIIRGVLGLDLYKGTAEEVSEGLKNDPEVLARSLKALRDAAEFLCEHCHVVGLGLLPYSYQAVLLADVFSRHPKPSEKLKKELVQWFWWTTVWGTFSGISGYRLTGMVKYLRDIARGKIAKWPRKSVEPTPLPATLTSRSARIHALAIMLFEMQGSPDILRRRLESEGAGALVKGLASRDPGLSFLVASADEEDFRDALELQRSRGQNVLTLGDQAHKLLTSSEFREGHAISARAWELLGKGDDGGFVRERRQTLADYEAEFLNNLGKPPGCV